MDVVETGKLLTIVSGFDRFVQVDAVTVAAWHLALTDVDFAAAQRAVVAHFSASAKPLTVADLRTAVGSSSRSTPRLIAEDVRAARARGLIPQGWPESRRLPTEVLAALTRARDEDRDLSLDDPAPAGVGIATGVILKRPEDA